MDAQKAAAGAQGARQGGQDAPRLELDGAAQAEGLAGEDQVEIRARRIAFGDHAVQDEFAVLAVEDQGGGRLRHDPAGRRADLGPPGFGQERL